MKVQHNIMRNFDSGRSVLLVLLDTSAAFDMINIEQLLSTLDADINLNSTTTKPSPNLELPGLTLQSTDAARNLGRYFDRHVQLDRLISSYCSSAYYHLCLISRVYHLLTRDTCHAAVRSLLICLSYATYYSVD